MSKKDSTQQMMMAAVAVNTAINAADCFGLLPLRGSKLNISGTAKIGCVETSQISLCDKEEKALQIKAGSTEYMRFDTKNKKVVIFKDSEQTGNQTVTGALTVKAAKGEDAGHVTAVEAHLEKGDVSGNWKAGSVETSKVNLKNKESKAFVLEDDATTKRTYMTVDTDAINPSVNLNQNTNVDKDLTVSGTTFLEKTRMRSDIVSIDNTAKLTLTPEDSGRKIILNGTLAVTGGQLVQLPTITTDDIGTYYDFIVTVTGNSGAAGSYKIQTGGNATNLALAPTASYDDFVGRLPVLDAAATTTLDKSAVAPSAGDGTLVLALNTANGTIQTGTYLRCTAIAASTTTAGTDVWLLEGMIITNDATGFVTTNLFVA